MIIYRPKYLEALVSKQGNGMVKTITGVRRSGKSFLMGTLLKKRFIEDGMPESAFIEMAFDRYGSRRFRDPEVFFPWIVDKVSSRKESIVLLDEVQLLGNFEEILIDLMARPGVDVYVTGSNAKLLSKDIATEFRGRGDEVMMRPLSFSEFISARGGDAAAAYEEFSVYGGMPATLSLDTGDEKTSYLKSLFSEIYINDIVERYGVRNLGDLETIIDVLSSGVGSLTNPKRIADTFSSSSSGKGPGPDTVRSYIEHFKDAFLIEEAKRFDVKGRKYIGSPFKYYFCDMGLRNARMNFRQVEPTHAMENVLYNELRYRGYGVDVGTVERFEREGGKTRRAKLEIDFICNRGSKRYYIQSAYAIPDEAKLRQEQSPLLGTGDSFKKVIVVRDPVVPRYNDDGVLVVGLLDFLLDESLIDY